MQVGVGRELGATVDGLSLINKTVLVVKAFIMEYAWIRTIGIAGISPSWVALCFSFYRGSEEEEEEEEEEECEGGVRWERESRKVVIVIPPTAPFFSGNKLPVLEKLKIFLK